MFAQLSAGLVAVPFGAMPSAADCTGREWKRSCRRGWSFVAGIAAVDSGSFAVASGGFGADSGLDSRLGSARGLLEGLELGFVVAMAVAVAVAVAAAGAAVVAETTD